MACFFARSDGDDLAGGVVELAVDEAEPLRPLATYVELDPREPGQVATDVSVAEFLADDASVRQVVDDGCCSRDDV